MKRILIALTLLCWLPAQAVVLYYENCGPGSHASCVNGSDSNDGLSVGAPKLTAPSSTQINAAACGDQFLLARGSVFNGYTPTGNIGHGQNCQANPVIISDYEPRVGVTGRPKLQMTASGNVLPFGGYNNTSDDRGYAVRNIEIAGVAVPLAYDSWTNEYGIVLMGRISYVEITNVDMHDFRIPIYIAPNDTILNPTIDHVQIWDSFFHNSYSMGILGTANHWVIERNNFYDINYHGSAGNHAIYVNGVLWAPRYITFRGNTFTNVSRDLLGVDAGVPGSDSASGVCEGGNLTGRAIDMAYWVMEDNLIKQEYGSAQGCYGISVSAGYDPPESMTKVTIRRNTVINVGECGVCTNTMTNALVENNVVLNFEAGGSHIGVFTTPSSEIAMDNNVYRNNSTYMTSPTEGYGVNTVNLNTGVGNTVANNLTVFGTTTGGVANCTWQEAIGAYSSFRNNWCYRVGGTGTFRWSIDYPTLALAQAAGYDTDGVLGTDPQLAATPTISAPSMQIQTGSPAVGAGTNTSCARLTKDGKVRTGTCTVGAYQPGL